MKRDAFCRRGIFGGVVVSFTAVVASAATIWITGDSTTADWSESSRPYKGWGQVLQPYFDSSKIRIRNIAFNGASIVSYRSSGYWKRVSDSLKKGDYLFVQFAHNTGIPNSTEVVDSAMYSDYLDTFYNAAVRQGARPVFLTSNNASRWANDTVTELYCQPGNNFCQAMVAKAKLRKVPLLDIQKLSVSEQERVGFTYSRRFWFAILDSGEYPTFPSGKNDNVHLQEMGALNVANQFRRLLLANRDSSLGPLRSAILACESLVVKTQVAVSKDSITASGCYPAGTNITLKVLGGAARGVRGWMAEDGSLDTSKISTFKMPKKRVVRTVVFNGRGTAGLGEVLENGGIRVNGMSIVLDAEPREVRAYSLSGSEVELGRRSSIEWRLPSPGAFVVRWVDQGSGRAFSRIVSAF